MHGNTEMSICVFMGVVYVQVTIIHTRCLLHKWSRVLSGYN